ncbi:MAG TPA: amidohydrolase [Terriglobales bacterium]|nr:amidohydrolase [Terriglobales bacterium]
MDKDSLSKLIEQNAKTYETLSDAVWESPELCYKETTAAALHVEALKAAGFKVTCPAYGINTAYLAEYGERSPVIALLSEYDALDGMSQEADANVRSPIIPGGPGHGCGHQLLGAAVVEAGAAVKAAMEQEGVKGTLRILGCPAEEGGGGKVFLIRAGAFKDVDIALSWHPNDEHGAQDSALAVVIALFSFTGKAAHAAAAPEKGRSALDAAELMNVGTQFLREHVPDDVRIHYAFHDVGGLAANVVQANAKLQYVIRAKKNATVLDVYSRICDIAKGAALMAGVEVSEPVIVGAYADFIPNETLGGLINKHQNACLPIEYTEEELAYAKRFQKDGKAAEPICSKPPKKREGPGGSTDLADVSWVVPTGAFYAACSALGTVPHSWELVAQGKSSIAHKGMHHAAEVLAASALDLFADPTLVDAAKADFAKATQGEAYKSLLPEDAEPQ